jgi:hypothetical protein
LTPRDAREIDTASKIKGTEEYRASEERGKVGANGQQTISGG